MCRQCAGNVQVMNIYNLLKILTVCMMCIKRMEIEQKLPQDYKPCFLVVSHLFYWVSFIYYLYYLHIMHIVHTNNNNSKLHIDLSCTLPAHQLLLPAHLFNRTMVNPHRINIQYIKIIKQKGESSK